MVVRFDDDIVRGRPLYDTISIMKCVCFCAFVCVNSTEKRNRQRELLNLTEYQVVYIDVRGMRTVSHLSNFRTKGTSDGSEGDIKPGVDERYGHPPSPPTSQSFFPFLFLFPERREGGGILGSLNKEPPPPFLLNSENGLPVLARRIGRQMSLL